MQSALNIFQSYCDTWIFFFLSFYSSKAYIITLWHIYRYIIYIYIYIYTVELVQSDILWHPTTIYGPKVFLLTKIKPEYSDILYNLTHFPGYLVCQIRQVPLYIYYNFQFFLSSLYVFSTIYGYNNIVVIKVITLIYCIIDYSTVLQL